MKNKMRRINIIITVLALMLTLTACGKSEFGVTENSWKHMTLTAQNADKDAFVMVGSLDVADGEQIEITASLTKGSVKVEIVRSPDNQSIDEIPEMDGKAIITANLARTEGTSGTVPAGTYLLRATCLEKATGTIQIDVSSAENSGSEGNHEPVIASESAAPTEPPEAASEPGRQNGERFEDVIILEGMEETVYYEHIRNDALGFEMDYDYERFVRHSEQNREIFVSCWDDPNNPENYLEVRYSPLDAESAAASTSETLSNDYEISRDDSFPLDRAGSCIRILAEEVKGGGYMPDQLQTVYVIPAADGCRIATAHCATVESEGFLRRFRYMMNTFSAVAAQMNAGENQDQQSVSGTFTGVQGTEFVVPDGFIQLDESPNIGYQYTFWHPDYEIRIVVCEIAPGYFPESAYETDYNIASKNPDVTYFNHGDNWFVQSGYNNNGEEIFYSKESTTDRGLKTFWITYPTAKREFGDPIAAEFEKNCRF